MKPTRTLTRIPSIACPHCASKMIVRDSQEVTPIVRELRLACTNDDCGFSAVGQLALIREIRAATRPDQRVALPAGQWSRPKPANENHPTPANDDREERAANLGALIGSLMTT